MSITGKLVGAIIGLLLFRNPWGAIIGLILGHFYDQSVVTVPAALLPEIRRLLAAHKTA